MTGWLIYDKKQYENNEWFAAEILKNCSPFCKIKTVLAEELVFGAAGGKTFFEYGSKSVAAPSFAVNRSIFPLLSQTLEKSGTRVFNSFEVSALCNDKRKTYLAVSGLGGAVLKTAFFEKRFFDPASAKCFGFPCVLKSAAGHGGREVFLIHDEKELEKCLSALDFGEFLLQEFCSDCADIRVYVLGGKVLGAVLRKPRDGSFKSNFSLGGSVRAVEMNKALLLATKRVLAAFSHAVDFVGIDFLFDGKNYIFNEIEDVVGTRMLYKTTDVDAAKEFSRYIENVMKAK